MISEIEIRKLCKDVLTPRYSGALVRDELGLLKGSNRVDVAILTDTELIGVEVKSSADTLARLPAQSIAYSMVFDRVELFCSEKHFKKAQALVPEYWGLWCVTSTKGGWATEQVANATPNPDLTPEGVASLLWKEDVQQVLREHGLLKGLSVARLKVLQAVLCKHVPLVTIRSEVRSRLRNRRYGLGGFAG